jgi:hypothetical protein
MHAQASSQAMRMAPGLPTGDTIPFGTIITIFYLAMAATTSQICGCFLLDEF